MEIALGVKESNLPLVAMNELDHARNSKPDHSSGKKLMDLADVVVDNQCPSGDCVSEISGIDWRIGPTSTVTGAMVINMIHCATAKKLLERGHQFIGTPAAEKQLERYYEAYRKSLGHLFI